MHHPYHITRIYFRCIRTFVWYTHILFDIEERTFSFVRIHLIEFSLQALKWLSPEVM